MKLASRKVASVSQQRRDNLLAERMRAVAVRDLHPGVGQLRIELVFSDATMRTPSPQSHTFYPAARAFFRFACPCSECDGQFDLREAVRTLVTGLPTGKRGATRAVQARMQCDGVRLRDRVGSRDCSMMLDYRLEATAADPNA